MRSRTFNLLKVVTWSFTNDCVRFSHAKSLRNLLHECWGQASAPSARFINHLSFNSLNHRFKCLNRDDSYRYLDRPVAALNNKKKKTCVRNTMLWCFKRKSFRFRLAIVRTSTKGIKFNELNDGLYSRPSCLRI